MFCQLTGQSLWSSTCLSPHQSQVLAQRLSAHLQKQGTLASTKDFVMICNDLHCAGAVFWEPGLAQGGTQ